MEVSIFDDGCRSDCFFAHQGDTGRVTSACELDLVIVRSTSSVLYLLILRIPEGLEVDCRAFFEIEGGAL